MPAFKVAAETPLEARKKKKEVSRNRRDMCIVYRAEEGLTMLLCRYSSQIFYPHEVGDDCVHLVQLECVQKLRPLHTHLFRKDAASSWGLGFSDML
jgi:hypothetical protein